MLLTRRGMGDTSSTLGVVSSAPVPVTIPSIFSILPEPVTKWIDSLGFGGPVLLIGLVVIGVLLALEGHQK